MHLQIIRSASHVELYRWLAALTPYERSERCWNGKPGEIWRWQWLNQVPIRGGEDALWVN